ncbi:hypothetical protein [Paenibacillus sp. GCM10027626]|uniref:hypothetical protein n=1 Tax=Paenibacillus sp. GCM10027626 TaxID=3273411 RepID=UPI0036437618
MYKMNRKKETIGIGMLLLAVMLLIAGCETAGPTKETNEMHFTIPDVVVDSITTFDDQAGNKLATITDQTVIVNMMEELKASELTFFDDPEPLGQLLRVEAHAGEHTVTYYINDLRNTASYEVSGKIYSKASSEKGLVWRVSSKLIRQLRGEAADQADSTPYLYIETYPDSSSIVVEANQDLQKSSIRDAVDATLARSGFGKEKPLDYELFWSDQQRFAIQIIGLEPGEAASFNLDLVMTTAGMTLANQDQPYRNRVVLEKPALKSRMRTIDVETNEETASRVPDTAFAQNVLVQSESGKDDEAVRYTLYYGGGSEQQTLVPLGAGEQQQFRISEWPDAGEPFANDYGYELLFSDRFYPDYTYAVLNNRTLYKVNWKAGTASKLYESPERPVYGISSSPGGKEVALLVAADQFIGADADLLILNDKGKVLKKMAKAAFVSHSDGFLFPYPVSWLDDKQIIVPIFGIGDMQYGQAKIDRQRGKMISKTEMADLPPAAAELLKQKLGKSFETMRVLPQPSSAKASDYIAVETSEAGIWLLNLAEEKATWLGNGKLLGWSGEGRLAIWEPKDAGSMRLFNSF